MKKRMIVIVAVLLCGLFTGSPDLLGAIIYDSGQEYDIDFVLNDKVYVWNNAGYEPTTLNLLTGSVLPELHVWDTSQINIWDGRIAGVFRAWDSSWVTMSGGVANGLFEVYNFADITGGYIKDFQSESYSFSTISYTALESLRVNSSSIVDIDNTSIDLSATVHHDAILTIDSATVGGDLALDSNSQLIIFGGTFGGIFDLRDNSVMTIHGNNFNYDCNDIITDLTGVLTGTLINGDPINNRFYIYENAAIILVCEPIPLPPEAHISGGPYVIRVGDSLILDASGSSDPDGDIVSFLWDLDDDGVFETTGDDRPIFEVSYSYLESLGLLINHEYTIHLKTVDNDNMSDTVNITLMIVPKPAFQVALDIKPGSCPNPVNTRSSGVLPVAILGSNDLDVTMIDPASIRLAGVEPLRSSIEDVATPAPDIADCNCVGTGPDGLLDLTLKFRTQAIIEATGDIDDGDIITLELTGILYDSAAREIPIAGHDCILIRGKHRAYNNADTNRDGFVDGTDFLILSENWLTCTVETQ